MGSTLTDVVRPRIGREMVPVPCRSFDGSIVDSILRSMSYSSTPSYDSFMRIVRSSMVGAVALVVAAADVPEGVDAWQPWALLLALLTAAALASRNRSRPFGAVASLAMTIAFAVAAEIVGEPGQIPFGVFVVIALLIADVAFHEPARVVAGVVALAAVAAVLGEGLAAWRGASDVAFVAMLWAWAGAVAVAVRWRRQATDARDDRVRMLERERIARDLHDVVAHHVSAIALTAEGARGLVGIDDTTVRASLGSIHTTSATALDEMRRMVAILRSDDEAQPSMRLADVAASVITHGPPEVMVTIADEVNEPPAHIVAGVSRIVQEAVTNSRRHARDASAINVDMHRCEGDLVVSVVDDGRGPTGRSSGGYGLVGIRERVEVLGGSCRVGPGKSGGWFVEARLPLDHRA